MPKDIENVYPCLSVTAMSSFCPAQLCLPPSQTQGNRRKGLLKVRVRDSAGEAVQGLKDGQSLAVDLNRG